jgi:radical SAM superfamily enzyme YgiQ (UPF0313 family)
MMNVFLINPAYPKTFLSLDKALRMMGKEIGEPPLGLLTLAALLPEAWNLEVIELTTREISENDWNRCDTLMISGMVVQSHGIYETVRDGRRRGKTVVVGGPWAFHCPQDFLDAGADIVVRGEAEQCISRLLEALERGESGIIIEPSSPANLKDSPVPIYDLLDLDAYAVLDIQFSRGCPFNCEFCDITLMLGRKVRIKSPHQILRELQNLFELGWRSLIHFVDDNFIGNPSRTKELLREMIPWMEERGHPFEFCTQASLNLASDPEMLDLMVRAGFINVLLGIETLDEESLKLTKKTPNIGMDINQACRTINQAGLRITASCIVGFDNESTGADRRLIDFASQNDIPQILINLLQAVPGTGLWRRLEKEGRLRWRADDENIVNQIGFINFVPTRPIDEIVEEFIRLYDVLYDPGFFLKRTYRHFLRMKPSPVEKSFVMPSCYELLAVVITIFKQGLLYSCRWKFWKYFFAAMFKLQRRRFEWFITVCILGEHYFEYRETIREKLQEEFKLKRHMLIPDSLLEPNLDSRDETCLRHRKL